MMTQEEWQKAEVALSYPLGRVEMKIDGNNVTVVSVQIKPLHYCLAVYINGEFKAKWALEDCDIRRRFCQRHTKSLLTAKEKKNLKRERKAVRDAVLKKAVYEYYEPYWNTFRSMKSHFIKNNESIELVETKLPI